MAAALTVGVLVRPAAARAQIGQDEFAQRRAALAARMGDGVFLAIGGEEPAEDYLIFNQRSPFLYLAGFNEPSAALVIVKRGGAVTRTILFVQPKDPSRETWTGTRVGVAGVQPLTGMEGRPSSAMRATVDSVLGEIATGTFYVAADQSPQHGFQSGEGQLIQALRAAHAGIQMGDGGDLIDHLRGHKSAVELELLRKSAEITAIAQREAMKLIEPEMNEFEVQALIEYTFRRNGADRPSFSTIVGSGPNSTTLHYSADDRFMRAGDLVVMDIGSSYRGYSADVTRTVPVSGTFTADQRALYQVVRDAQAAGERQARPGTRARVMSDSASAVLAAGLTRLGLIESPDATYDCREEGGRQCRQLSLYYFHALGHGIGLDVHDPDQYYETGVLAPGSAFTIEPGVYVRGNLLDIIPQTPRNRVMVEKIRAAVMRFADTGIRIEDDYLITDAGLEWISRAPREIAEVEAMMRETFAGPAPRDSVKVNWYRRGPGARD
jgi:Xaa-Pro aminopeptidase